MDLVTGGESKVHEMRINSLAMFGNPAVSGQDRRAGLTQTGSAVPSKLREQPMLHRWDTLVVTKNHLFL